MKGKPIFRMLVIVASFIGVLMVILSCSPADRKHPKREAVHFWHRWGGEWADIVAGICEEFNQSQQQYEVIPLSLPSRGADMKLIMGTVGGNPPDVMSIWNGAIPNLAASGLLTNLDTVMTPQESRQFRSESYPAIRDCGMYDNKVYGVTIGSDLYALYVNVDHVKAAGLDIDKFPKTLEGLMEWGRKLNRFDKEGKLTRIGLLHSSLDYNMHGFGGAMMDEKGNLTLNTPQNLACLKSIVDYRAEIGFEKVNRFVSGLNSGSDTGGWPFITGDYSITFDGQWRVEEIRKYAPKMNYRVIPVPPPAKNGKSLAGVVSGNFMIVPAGAKQKRGAWEFIKFWSGIEDPNRAASLYNKGGWLPLTPKVTDSPVYQAYLRENPQYRAFLQILASPNCKIYPRVPYLQYMIDRINRAEDHAIRQVKSPEKALDDLQTEVQDEVRKRRELGYRE